MKKRRIDAWQLLKETYAEWRRDNALRFGAALSYYTVFSLPPLLFLAVAVAGVVYGEEAAQGHLVAQAKGVIGEIGAEAIQAILKHTGGETRSLLAAITGLVVLVVGATAVFAELQHSLNTIWGIREKPGRTIVSMLRTRLLSFAVVLGIGFFMLVSLVLSALVAALGGVLRDIWFVPLHVVYFLHVLNFLVSFLVVTVLFAMIYKVLPYARIAWRDVWLGAAATAFLFTIGKFFVGLYLGGSGIVSAYRATGSLIVLFVWIYFSAQILYLGAEFTEVHARRRGRKIEPSEHAEWIPEGGSEIGGLPSGRKDSAA
jgi:membrane protein